MEPGLSLTSQYADVGRVRDFAGFTLAETTFRPAVRMPLHEHDLAHFYLVLNGSCTDSHGRTLDPCVPSTLMFHPAGARHSCDYRGSGARTLFIQIEDGWLERVREHSGLPDHSFRVGGGMPVWLATRLSSELWEDTAPPLVIEGLVLQLLGEVFRGDRAAAERWSPRWVRHVRDLLRARFSERLTLDEIARAVGHPDRLCHGFREQ